MDRLARLTEAQQHAWRRGLRAAVAAPLALAAAWALVGAQSGLYAAFGSFCLLVFADVGGPLLDRFTANILIGAAAGCLIVAGTLVAPWLWLASLAAAVVGVVLVLASVLRGYVAAAVLPLELAYVLAATSGPSTDQLGEHLLAWSVGVVAAAVAAVVLWPQTGTSAPRALLGDVLTAAGDAVAARWPRDGSASVPAAVEDADVAMLKAHQRLQAVFRSRLTRPGVATARDRAVLQLVEETSRLRIALRWAPRVLAGDGAGEGAGEGAAERGPVEALPDDAALAAMTEDSLREDARALAEPASPLRGRIPSPPDPRPLLHAREEHVELAAAWAGAALAVQGPEAVRDRLDRAFPLRMAAMVASFIGVHTMSAVRAPWPADAVTMFGWSLPQTPWVSSRRRLLAAQLAWDSPWLRNALRTGLGLALAVLVALSLGLEHAFWVVLGTLSVLRFDALGTGRTAAQAVAGTFAGVVAGAAVVGVAGDWTPVLWLLLVPTAFLAAYSPGVVPFAVGQAAFSLFVVVLFALVAGPDGRTAELRLEDVAVGVVVSVVVGLLLWPRGVIVQVHATLADALSASADYLRTTGEAMADRASEQEVLAAHAQAVAAVARAAETFDLAFVQRTPGQLQVRAWARLSATAAHTTQATDLLAFLSSRLVLAGADRPGRGEVDRWPATPAVAAAAVGLAERLEGVAEALRRAPGPTALADDEAVAAHDDDPALPWIPAPGAAGARDPGVLAAREAVTATLAGWTGRDDDRLGEDVVATAWGVDQLAHVAWLTRIAEGAVRSLTPETSVSETHMPS